MSASNFWSGSAWPIFSGPNPERKATHAIREYQNPRAGLSAHQKAEIGHRVTDLLVEYFSEAARPHTMVLIEEVKDGGYYRADETFVIPDGYRAT